MTSEEKLTKTVTPAVIEELYNQKIAPFLNGAGNNYSLDEQVVGTWIDGSMLYQKTVTTGSSVPTGGTLIQRIVQTGYDTLLYIKIT